MEDALRSAIERQAKKLIARHKGKFAASKDHAKRYRKRTGNEPALARIRNPGVWSTSPHFDPLYCISHSRYLAKIIWRKIIARSYEPSPAVLFQIPKDAGGFRDIMVFSIPDAAVANLFNKKIRDRNRNIQSPFCYSYRKDRSLFDAVLHTHSLMRDDKTYVIQYDFSKYFDTIKHDYLRFILEKGEFSISPAEIYVIERFLNHKYATPKDYKSKTFDVRKQGVPQGCSLSLFLSNMAGHELDKELERSNGSFVRFADDIVCFTHTYKDALRVTEAFKEHGYYSGIKINLEKSPGICLLDTGKPGIKRDYFVDGHDVGPISMISEFDYIGHKFSSRNVGISSKALMRVQIRIAKIIYIHLLHNPKRGLFNSGRVGPGFHDWDLATCLNELRAYIYGGLSEQSLRAFIDSNVRIERFRGLMSFYPLVSDVSQFAKLDGWLLSVVRRAMKARSQILASQFQVSLAPIMEGSLKSGDWYQYSHEIGIETKMPSFVVAWRAARKAFKQYGLADFESPEYYSSLIV